MSAIITYFFKVIQLIRLFLYPILKVLAILVPKVKKRLDFEAKNDIALFKHGQIDTDLLFEVASEGEFEQVMPVIDHFLAKGAKVDLLFASSSVEAKALLKSKNSKLRVWRLPILSYGPAFLGGQQISKMFKPKLLIMCRYDFYPELMNLAVPKVLISGSLKNKTSGLACSYYQWVLSHFDQVVFSSYKDQERLKSFNYKNDFLYYDFRINRILERSFKRNENICQRLPVIGQDLITCLQSLSADKKIILGNLWPSDMAGLNWKTTFEQFDKIIIVPHLLDQNTRSQFKEFCDFGVITPETTHSEVVDILRQHKVIYLQISGILCELYGFFEQAYVGGGLERSIHSVLEPYLNDCFVYVSGNIKRSSEFEFIDSLSPERIFVLKSKESVKINPYLKSTVDKDKLLANGPLILNKIEECYK